MAGNREEDILTNGNQQSGATDKMQASLDLIGDMLSPEVANAVRSKITSDAVDGPFVRRAIEQTFADTWGRGVLSRRERSLITLAILITLRASDEMYGHFKMGITNGLSMQELQELIIHVMNYAGAPAAVNANNVAMQAFKELGLVESEGKIST
jgi:4-carboxymuconolactone decarboxylase